MLILTKDGISKRLKRGSFEDEAAMQEYFSANPEAIPLNEEDDDRQLHVLGREFQTSLGRIDILGTDAEGEVYIVETKRNKNADRRQVLAQVLDYGAALWDAELDFQTVLEALQRDAQRRNAQDPLESLAAFLGTDKDAATAHLENVCTALAEGHFTAIVLMDQLDERIRVLIRFMNEKSEFRIRAIEFDFYTQGDTKLVYPRLFGGGDRKPVGKAARNRRGVVDPEVFLLEYAKTFGQETVDAWRIIEKEVENSAIPGIGIGHRPKGNPFIFLSNTSIGDVRLFILVDGSAEVRDYLHFNADAFTAHPAAREAREFFRKKLVNDKVSGARVDGTVGRIYTPVISFAHGIQAIMVAVREFAKVLEQLSLDSSV